MIVTFETAKKLKSHGYPEPTFRTGQIWYNEFGVKTFIGKENDKEDGLQHFVCTSVGSGRTMEMILEHGEGTYFAASALDILIELQKKTANGFFWCLTPPLTNDGLWSCVNYYRSEGKNQEFVSECPADCCAQAYLSLFKIS